MKLVTALHYQYILVEMLNVAICSIQIQIIYHTANVLFVRVVTMCVITIADGNRPAGDKNCVCT